MSLNFIKPINTIISVTEDEIWYSNPSIDIELSSTGEVRGKVYGTAVTPNYFGYYPLVVSNEQQTFKRAASFNSLFSRIVLGVPLKSGCALRLKTAAKGYVPENVETFHVRNQRVLETQKQPELPILDAAPMIVDQLVTEPLAEKFYTIIEGTQAFRTEDFVVFPTLSLANWHQDNVSRGKGNAQIVLDYDGGWKLAEAIYHQEVKYKKGLPYENFCDVLANNKGIEDISEADKVCFKNSRKMFEAKGIDAKYVKFDLYRLTYSLEEAEEIQEKLEAYCIQAKLYEEALNNIKLATRALNKAIAKEDK